jgi:HEAT repeat protein
MYLRCTPLAVVAGFLILALAPLRADERASATAAAGQWRKQLASWGQEYFGPQSAENQALWEQGREQLASVDDPAAIPPIVALLKTEKHPQFRRALIVPLIQLGGKEATSALVKWSVEDDNPLLREEAATGLAGKEGLDAHLDTYIAYLKSPKYVANAAEALSWTRLAQPLSTVERPNEKLTKALIQALHTRQQQVVPYSVSYDSGTRISMDGMGNAGPWRKWGTDEGWVRVRIPVPQPKVVAALQEYTGQQYQYDTSQWQNWLRDRLSAQ